MCGCVWEEGKRRRGEGRGGVLVQTVKQRLRICPGTHCVMQQIRGNQTPQNKSRTSAPPDPRPDDSAHGLYLCTGPKTTANQSHDPENTFTWKSAKSFRKTP